MARERSLKTKYEQAQKQLRLAREIIVCQKLMDIKMPESMAQAIDKFLTETE